MNRANRKCQCSTDKICWKKVKCKIGKLNMTLFNDIFSILFKNERNSRSYY